MKYLLVCLVFLIGCGGHAQWNILHLTRHDGTKVRCKAVTVTECQPNMILLHCDDGRPYDCFLEQE